MFSLQNTKFVNVCPPVAIKDNASYTTTSVDTKGYDWCVLAIALGATDIAMAALKLQDSDDDSTYGDVDGLNFGDTADLDIAGAAAALPSATDDNKIFLMEVDCRKRKRYLDLVATAGDGAAGMFLAVIAILGNGEISPVTAAERGCQQILRV